jgi:hypothetical protein
MYGMALIQLKYRSQFSETGFDFGVFVMIFVKIVCVLFRFTDLRSGLILSYSALLN